MIKEFKLGELRDAIRDLYRDNDKVRTSLLGRIDKLEAQAGKWTTGLPEGEVLKTWKKDLASLQINAVLTNNPLIDFDKLVFVKRLTYSANHYYTEHINSQWTPGGNLCVLDLKTGGTHELVPELKNGVFERFDISFDAKKIVFAWKCEHQKGYRIYEIGIDPATGKRVGELKQITFPQKNEQWLVKMYRARPHYHHGTDDMSPIYLPDGDICFISTRCQYGILCDGPDDFTTTVLYRIGPDGKNLRVLSRSSVSEEAPTMLPDGRIMYTRWEYVDKGAVSVKCLWAMRQDGSASSEIYANDISLPPTFTYGRPIPDAVNKYVVCGVPHCPQNSVGTVIRLDMSKNIRSRDPMTYMTPDVDIRSEPGFAFRKSEKDSWNRDRRGRGRLFTEPYPLSEKYILVSHKPAGPSWTDPKAYGLYLLDEKGKVYRIYDDLLLSAVPAAAAKEAAGAYHRIGPETCGDGQSRLRGHRYLPWHGGHRTRHDQVHSRT